MKEDLIKLRELTGAGVMECKRALDESKGDFEKAKEYIRKAGAARAEKKKERKTGAGLLHSYIHNNRVGVLIEVRCETDFVARSDPFQNLVHELTLHIAATDPENPEALLKEPYVKDESLTIAQLIDKTIAQVGENIQVERFARFEI
ncbi:MAG: Elongation factor Ts [Candidatus Jorgensenbacteria bacterium GW2011_GWA2_45_13]|uniref:Elongation factor Ts n=1 Tax=Candidatus Jorgensenbacteria bacterium GW2011_GWA2_45_13 TaxID=1618662 RepID=A0A0G1L4S3_9BACT|nr:MAG: Elongation factor Ts [Candidatus Jorgensenbacteria bacterium GW2011_GWA2_45_13]